MARGDAPERAVNRLPKSASFLTLAALACRLALRRWPIFGPAVAVAIVVQAFVALVWRVPHGSDLDTYVALPILTTLVYAFVAADVRSETVAVKLVWERFLERCWAVIAIDFVLSLVSALGLSGSASGDLLDAVAAAPIFILSALLVFADASATVDDDLTVWSVIPLAIARSVSAAWQRAVFARAIAIFGLQLLVFGLQTALYALLQHQRVPDALFWSEIPLLTVVLVPLSALTVLVYLTATATRTQASE